MTRCFNVPEIALKVKVSWQELEGGVVQTSNCGNSRFEDDEHCFKCRFKDHWKRCLVRKEKQNKMKDAEIQAQINVSTGYDIDEELLTVTNEECNREVMANFSSEGSTSIWILDSSCLFHVYSNRKEFDTYEERKGSMISLGDKMSCDVLGMGTVKIKMHDGVVMSSNNILCIPFHFNSPDKISAGKIYRLFFIYDREISCSVTAKFTREVFNDENWDQTGQQWYKRALNPVGIDENCVVYLFILDKGENM
ncbi:unnamed protein product [Prunus brigantina]